MKRGRKPKSDNKKEYFGEREEAAVVAYNNTDDAKEKDTIYNDILKPAFIKMIESIIRRYKLYGPDEEFDITFNDALSFMITKVSHYRPDIYGYWPVEPTDKIRHEAVVPNFDFSEKKQSATDEDPLYICIMEDTRDGLVLNYYVKELRHFKAYSYCGTVAKNYLYQKIKQYNKNLQHNTPYEEVTDVINNDIRYTEPEDTFAETAQQLITSMSKEVRKVLDSTSGMQLSANEEKVGNALCILLDNWEEILDEGGSNKLNKSSVLYFLREETRLGTKEIRDGMKKYKTLYSLIKNQTIN